MSTFIKQNSLVLFQGDSITDTGRNRNVQDNLGGGYAMIAAGLFGAKYPELNVKFINKGISGNRVVDLENRWQTDCIDLKPDYVSILIGINDTWRRYDGNDITTTEQYEKGFRNILNRIKNELGAKIIICEPFLLHVLEGQEKWREDLDPKIQVARKLAKEFEAHFVAFDGMFAQKSTIIDPYFWARDGVHPTSAGHALMAKAWLDTVEIN